MRSLREPNTVRVEAASPQAPANVADYLRDQVARGNLAPGQRVTEIEVMRATGASRALVRQSLQRLATEGILIIEEFRGASVRSLSPTEVRHLYEVREVLEGLAARLAAEHAGAPFHRRLRELQDAMNAAASAGDHPEFIELNIRWHQAIIDASDNGYIVDTMRRLNVHLTRILSRSQLRRVEIQAANADHRQITRAILRRTPADAESLMRRHVAAARQTLAPILDTPSAAP